MEKTTETLLGNEATPKVETLDEMLQKARQKADAKVYYKWIAGFRPHQIETTVKELDTASVLKMVEMADQEIRQHPAKFI
jgi:pyruvate-formate lyase-activating enzyme